jgi:hypothetical protein
LAALNLCQRKGLWTILSFCVTHGLACVVYELQAYKQSIRLGIRFFEYQRNAPKITLMVQTGYFVETKERSFEIKFLVDADTATDIASYGPRRLKADPYGSGPHDDEYRTSSLYFDTNDFAVFRMDVALCQPS